MNAAKNAEGDQTDEARDVVRDASRVGREARTSALTTVYGLLLVAVMGASMGMAALMRALAANVSASAGAWAPWVLALLGLAALMRGGVALGPVHAEPPVARWLVPTPIRRWLVVRSRIAVTAALMALAGAGCGIVVAIASHPGSVVWARVLAGTGDGAVTALACLVVTLVAQSRSWSAALGRGATLIVAACAAVAVVGLRSSTRWWAPPSAWGWGAYGVIAGVSLVIVLVGATRVARLADAVSARDAARAGALVSAATGSVVMLDAGMFDVRRDARRLARRGRAPSRASRGGVHADVIVRDLRSCMRRDVELLAALALVVPAVMLGELFGMPTGVVAVTFAAWVAASRAGEGLATWLGSSSLWRIFPQRPAALTACFAVAPLLASAVVAALGAVMLSVTPWFVVACAGAVVAGLVRRVNAPDMQLGAVIDTGLGTIPTGIVMRLVHGPDIPVLVVAVGLASWPMAAALGLVALVWQVWRAGPGTSTRTRGTFA